MSLRSSGKSRKETSSLLIIFLATLVDLLYLSYPLLAMATPTLCYRSRLLLLLLNNDVSTVKKIIKQSKNIATCAVNKKYHWHHCMYKYIYKAMSLRILLPNDLKFAHCILQWQCALLLPAQWICQFSTNLDLFSAPKLMYAVQVMEKSQKRQTHRVFPHLVLSVMKCF